MGLASSTASLTALLTRFEIYIFYFIVNHRSPGSLFTPVRATPKHLRKVIPPAVRSTPICCERSLITMSGHPDLREALNVLRQELQACSYDPLTGYFRDGCCNTDEQDRGLHVVCAVMTAEFLEYSRAQGNDLITPRPQWRFKGLQPGNRWCLCALRWKEALGAGVAPKVVLQATHIKALEVVDLQDLMAHAHTDTRT